MNSDRTAGLGTARLVRYAALALFAIGFCALTLSVSAAALLRNTRPNDALAFAPFDARAQSNSAAMAISSPASRPENIQFAADHARRALLRDPTIAAAWRTLAITEVAANRPNRASRLMQISARLSRRDLPTQLWLIEDRVQRDDIRGALRHYDVALRTSPASADLLLPVLAGATAHVQVVEPLAELLATDPSWSVAFIRRLVEDLPSASGAARLLIRMRELGPIPHKEELRFLIPALVTRGEYRSAWQVYATMSSPAEPTTHIRNGGFELPNTMPIFEWELRDQDGITAEMGPVMGAVGQAALKVRADQRGFGPAARQLLILGPGSYRLSSLGQLGGTSDARVAWRIVCAQSGAQLADETLRLRTAPSRSHVAFEVPDRNCAAQWLSLEVRGGTSSPNMEMWLDAVELTADPRSV